jgi:hypothetical protein
MAKLGDLIVRVGADTTQLNKKLGNARKSIAKNTREIQQLGRNMTVGITAPLALMGASSVQAFREQSKAIAQVEAGLKSTAGQVGMTSQELQKMATDLQNKTLFGDEVILKDATAQLLTFTNITGENFGRTQEAALDLATRLDGDLKSASIQLGKALNDPVANLSALSRSGIQFSEDQKAVIKSLTETGNLAEAQTLILDELNKQYGGSAEAAAEADGGFTQLANSFGDLQEEIGRLLVQYLRPIVDQLKTFVQFLQGTSDGTKRVALAIAGIAAAIGPVLLILPNLISGIKAAQVAFKFLNATMLANPFALAATALALVITGIIMLTDETKKATTAVEDLTTANKNLTLEEQKRNIEASIDKQKKLVDELKAEKDAKDAVVNAGYGGKAKKEQNEATTAYLAATGQLEKMGEMLAEVNSQLEGTGEDSNEAAGGTKTLTLEMVKASKAAFDLTQELALLGTQKSELFEGDPVDLNKAFFGDTANVDLGIDLGLDEFSEEFDEAFDIDDGTNAMIQNLAKIKEAATSSMMKALEVSNAFGMAFGAAVADVVSGEKTAGQALKNLAISAIRSLIQMAKMNVIANATSPTNPANLFSGGLSSPAFIVAGLSMLDGFIGSIAAFADGGIVSGPTLGLVGEYPGAKTNPEVIAPLDKLRGMLGGQSVQVTGKISGRDILLTSEMSSIDRNRVRGY